MGWNGDSPGSQAGAHPADASAGGPPPSSSNDGATSGAAQDSASSPPPAADGDKGPAERPVWSAAEQEAAWARQRAANKQRQRRISGDQYDEIELPENDADVERILVRRLTHQGQAAAQEPCGGHRGASVVCVGSEAAACQHQGALGVLGLRHARRV